MTSSRFGGLQGEPLEGTSFHVRSQLMATFGTGPPFILNVLPSTRNGTHRS